MSDICKKQQQNNEGAFKRFVRMALFHHLCGEEELGVSRSWYLG